MSRKHLLMATAALCVFAGGAVSTVNGQRKAVSAAEVNGTYRMNFRGTFKKFSNDIKLLALGKGKVRFAMDLVYPYKLRSGEDMVNMGSIDGEASISGDTAVFRSEDGACKITFKFLRPGVMKVVQDANDADCGFGHNVTADGTYIKVSAGRPAFESRND